jgi:hypothetical protein
MVAAGDAIQDEDMVNAMRVELTPLTTRVVHLWKKRQSLLERDEEVGTEELEMGAALDGMHMAVAAADFSGRWL